jgi:hypothetical protein
MIDMISVAIRSDQLGTGSPARASTAAIGPALSAAGAPVGVSVRHAVSAGSRSFRAWSRSFGHLKFTQKKNETRKPVVVEIPILPELQQVIDATPTGHLTFMVNQRGKAMLAQDFSRKMRKAAACAAAEGGASEMQLMAIFGWRDPSVARVYTQRANRGRMVSDSMHLLANRQNAERTNVSHFDPNKKPGGKKRVENLAKSLQ